MLGLGIRLIRLIMKVAVEGFYNMYEFLYSMSISFEAISIKN